jgi:hypothetical protein
MPALARWLLGLGVAATQAADVEQRPRLTDIECSEAEAHGGRADFEL